MEHRGIKFSVWADRMGSGTPLYRFALVGCDIGGRSEPFVQRENAEAAARAFIERKESEIRDWFNPPPRRPRMTPRKLDGLREILALVRAELEAGDCGAFAQGDDADAEDLAAAGASYLRALIRWEDRNN